ncbi:class I SAM-dependent DNA methyltransferase [Clostridium sp.]|uniref:class I SAM-dependent DNA methyltransferase n=1 Tax=Clostridium sp. TaxID=1506 RepID=UPI003D6D3B8A
MGFDNYAKTWDTDIRINRANIIANAISDSIGSNKNRSAMEFGCGTGLVSFNLYDIFKSIALIDSSEGMIDILKSKIDKYEVTNMFPYNLDISSKNSSEMKFDVIYNSMVLHHITDTEDIIESFHQLLNEDGYLCIVDLDEEDGTFHKKYPEFDGHNGFNQDALKSILVSCGFKDIESNTFYYGEKIINDQRVKYSLFLMTGRR